MKKELYPDNWNEIAKEIKRRDLSRCLRCGKTIKQRAVLTVHHLDRNPNNCEDTNLVTLCSRCHLTFQPLSPMRLVTFFDIVMQEHLQQNFNFSF